MGRPQEQGAFRMGEVTIPAMIRDLQERVRTQVPPLELLPTKGQGIW